MGAVAAGFAVKLAVYFARIVHDIGRRQERGIRKAYCRSTMLGAMVPLRLSQMQDIEKRIVCVMAVAAVQLGGRAPVGSC